MDSITSGVTPAGRGPLTGISVLCAEAVVIRSEAEVSSRITKMMDIILFFLQKFNFFTP